MSRYSDDDYTPNPMFCGYQLLGDSQFLRFSTTILRKERILRDGLAYIGLCVSGQTISDLWRRVRDGFGRTSEKVVVMIGTNDLLKNTSIDNMKNDIEGLILTLVESGVQKIVLLTIPPVPRLAKSYDHWSRLKEFNQHIKSLENDVDVSVVDAYPEFLKKGNKKRNSLLNSSRTSVSKLFSNLASSPTEPPKYKTNIRVSISVNSDDTDREIYVLPNDLSSRSTENSLNESSSSNRYTPYNESGSRKNGSLNERSRRREEPRNEPSARLFYTAKRKLSSNKSFGEDSPPLAKRMNGSLLHDDDHNDRFCEEDISFSDVSNAEQINLNLFEEYFSITRKKQDLIHLNRNGLEIIEQLIRKIRS